MIFFFIKGMSQEKKRFMDSTMEEVIDVEIKRPEKKDLTKMTFHEFVPTDRIRRVLNSGLLLKDTWNIKNWETCWKNEIHSLADYLKLSKEGYVKVNYVNNTNSKYGRVRPIHEMGLCCMRRKLRNYLVKDLYYDIDMKCCHVSILLSILEQTDYDKTNYENWLYYFQNRELVHEQLIEKWGNETDWKVFINSILYGGNKKQVKDEPFLNKLALEVNLITEYIIKRNPSFYRFIQRKNNNKDNLDGSFMAIYLQDHEYRIIEMIINFLYYETPYLTYGKYNILSYEFDGFKILKKNIPNVEKLLEEVNQLAQKKYKYVEFVNKPMTEMIDIPDTLEIVNEEAEYYTNFSDKSIVDILEKMEGENIMFHDNRWYYFDGTKWIMDSGKPYKLKDKIKDIVMKYFELHLDESNILLWENVKKNIPLLEMNKKLNEVIDLCKSRFIKSRVDFDTKEYLLGFDNGVYDLENDEFRPYRYDDFVTMTTRLTFQEREEDKISFLMDLFRKIYPEEDVFELMMTIRASGLCGRNVEKFILMNGSGRNGKGFTNEFQYFIMGDYAKYVEPSVITKPIPESGVSPNIANMDNKRLCFIKEPSPDAKINNSTMKSLTGGGILDIRGLYTNNTTTRQTWTLVMECNQRPKLENIADVAETDRFIDINHGSYFGDLEKDDPKHHRYVENKKLKENDFKKNYGMSFMHILLDYYRIWKSNNYTFILPDSVKKRSMKYLHACNPWYKYFHQLFYLSIEKNILTFHHIQNAIKDMDEVRNLPYNERKKMDIASLHKFFEDHGVLAKKDKKGNYYVDCFQLKTYSYSIDEEKEEEHKI